MRRVVECWKRFSLNSASFSAGLGRSEWGGRRRVVECWARGRSGWGVVECWI